MTNQQRVRKIRQLLEAEHSFGTRRKLVQELKVLEQKIPTTCSCCGDYMEGKHPIWRNTCSHTCARDLYD